VKTLRVCENNVSYRTAGEGRRLVLLHGTNNDGLSCFGSVVNHFADQRQVVTLDYAGCGASTIPDEPLSLEFLVEQVVTVIRDAAVGPVDVLGFSLGAVVAAALAADHSELVTRLVLVGGWAFNDPRHQLIFDTWLRLEALNPELGMRFALALAFSANFLGEFRREQLAQILAQKSPEFARRRIELGRDVDLRDRLPRISAPTLVVGLARDQFIAPDKCRDLARRIAGSSYVELPSGHAVTFEQPSTLVSVVRDFVFDAQNGYGNSNDLTPFARLTSPKETS
jgi:pimeloyl-ACP methyl ester carboxylesterase